MQGSSQTISFECSIESPAGHHHLDVSPEELNTARYGMLSAATAISAPVTAVTQTTAALDAFLEVPRGA